MKNIRTSLAVAAAIVSLSALVAAGPQAPAQQQESPTKGLVKKGKVPISSDIIRTKLPQPAEADLPNGLHLMVLEDRRLPQITFQIFIPGAGGYYDPADQPGLATFTAALMREGTKTRTSEKISQELEVMAASVNVTAGASGQEATVAGSCLTEQFSPLLDLASDILLHPSFPDEELSRYKQRLRTQLTQQRASAGFLAQEMYQRVVYGDHPASRIAATISSLDKTTRDSLVEVHRTRFIPDAAAMAIAGDISMADARKIVEAKLGAWTRAGVKPAAVTDPAPVAGAKIFFVARPNSVQTSLIVGGQAIERTNPDYDTLMVMNKVLGGGPTGRLFLHLREEKGYTYGIGSGLNAPMHRGDWSASTSVRTEVTEAALRDLLAEIAQMREQPILDHELADAKRSMIASFALSLESPAQLLNYHVTKWRYKLPADYWDKYADRVSAVTKEQAQAVARKYLAPERLQIVAVGDPAKVAETLKKFGAIESYDADGNKISTY